MKTPEDRENNVMGNRYSHIFKYTNDLGKAICRLLKRKDDLESELEAVKRERDAAVKDLTEGRDCYSCKHLGQRFAGPCVDCMSGHGYKKNNYEWRGVCPENTEVQDETHHHML